MKKIILAAAVFFLFQSQAGAETIFGKQIILKRTDCSTITQNGLGCWDTDNFTLCFGNGTTCGALYSAGGTDVPLADGGTGASLSDPGGDRFMGWDDTDGAVKFLIYGSSLSYDAATDTLSTVIENDSVALTTKTTGNYVTHITEGTAIDASAAGEGVAATVSVDTTELDSFTISNGGQASLTTTWNVASGTDPGFTASASLLTTNVPIQTTCTTAACGFVVDTTSISDDTFLGISATMTAGENLVIGNVCYIKSDGKLWKADIDALTTTSNRLFIATATISADATGNFGVYGYLRDDSGYNWTAGNTLYLSGTAGGVVATLPASSASIAQTVGSALSADILFFHPSKVIPFQAKSFVISGVTSSGDFGNIWKTPHAITIRAVNVVQVGATNVVGHLDECDGNGANCAGVDGATDITADGNNDADDGTLSNPSIDAGDWVGWHTTSVSGTNTNIGVTFYYTEDGV